MSTKQATLSSKHLKDGMIKSKKTQIGDLLIALFCLILMLICLIPMVHVLACSLSSADVRARAGSVPSASARPSAGYENRFPRASASPAMDNCAPCSEGSA